MTISRVLIIAGSDSGGGAGVQADLKTVSALGAFGMTAITALTAQNTTGVYGVLAVEPEFVVQQINVCVNDIGFDAVKTGMLVNAEIITAVAGAIKAQRLRPLVVDPVMIAKSGARLLELSAIEALKKELLPLATVVTPNLHEAQTLVGHKLDSIDEIKDAARAIRDLGPPHVVIKGGHVESIAADILYDGCDFIELRRRHYVTKNTQGTGCIFASAIAVSLAHQKTVRESFVIAKDFVTAAIGNSLTLGAGHGPANPMAFIEASGK